MKHLFTYGTLMNNRCRNFILCYYGFQYERDVRLSGYTIQNYPRGDFPVIFRGSDSDVVTGELWRFPDLDNDMLDRILEMLDAIEGEGTLYKREIVSVGGADTAIAYIGIPETWNCTWLTKAKFDKYNKWMGGECNA